MADFYDSTALAFNEMATNVWANAMPDVPEVGPHEGLTRHRMVHAAQHDGGDAIVELLETMEAMDDEPQPGQQAVQLDLRNPEDVRAIKRALNDFEEIAEIFLKQRDGKKRRIGRFVRMVATKVRRAIPGTTILELVPEWPNWTWSMFVSLHRFYQERPIGLYAHMLD